MPDKDDSEWLVQDAKLEWAEKTLRRCAPSFSDDEIIRIAWLVGCDDALSYGEDGLLQYDFNDLQLIAFGAVISSIDEVRNR